MHSAEEKGLKNIKTILAMEDELDVPEKNLDLIFTRNVFHHLKNRVEYFRNLADSLKPEGRLAIIEYKKAGDFSFHRIFGHYVLQETIIEEIEEAGYRFEKEFDFLPNQSFTIFSLK